MQKNSRGKKRLSAAHESQLTTSLNAAFNSGHDIFRIATGILDLSCVFSLHPRPLALRF